MNKNKIILVTNVNKSQITDTGTHWEIKNIPVTIDGAVMNGILYPAAENKAGMPSLVGKPVALSHPVDKAGNFMSALEGEGLEDFFSGGTITKTYNVKGVNYADARIKKSVLEAQERGGWYANALKTKSDIGVSTGLIIAPNSDSGISTNGIKYNQIAVQQKYDHLAILPDSEAPAGGNETFMRFNSADSDVLVTNIDDYREKPNMIDSFIEMTKAFFAGNSDTSYNINDKQGHTAEINGNSEVAKLDKEKLLKLMANLDMNIEGAADMDTDTLANAMSEYKKQPKDKTIEEDDEEEEGKKDMAKNSEMPDWAKTLVNKVDTLASQIEVNQQSKIDDLAEKVSKLATNSIPVDEAKKLSESFLKSHLAANGGYINANSAGGYNAPQKSSLAGIKMPGVK